MRHASRSAARAGALGGAAVELGAHAAIRRDRAAWGCEQCVAVHYGSTWIAIDRDGSLAATFAGYRARSA
ncbi:conserved hypothetical protein [Burkholderia pseudomallei MSHR346]|nr:conserved hypothetical protein [Burkholderia pseudomallei MSHR346]